MLMLFLYTSRFLNKRLEKALGVIQFDICKLSASGDVV